MGGAKRGQGSRAQPFVEADAQLVGAGLPGGEQGRAAIGLGEYQGHGSGRTVANGDWRGQVGNFFALVVVAVVVFVYHGVELIRPDFQKIQAEFALLIGEHSVVRPAAAHADGIGGAVEAHAGFGHGFSGEQVGERAAQRAGIELGAGAEGEGSIFGG